MEQEKFDFSNFSSFTVNGKVQDIKNLEEYLKKIDKENVSFKEKLQIGDEVKLKGVNYTVIVEYIDYEIPNLGIVDYVGKRADREERILRIFNQKDIESKIIKKKDEELEI